ncbi:hypothetical protein Kisp01_36990 [Kineosporia sp. NBRC 101677]|uniref:hypothetical protein n=1 Tax=Kineosporia sp. NBRC 101677 TaxID=3032197 RepID=UPI0024A1542E|nr:hypothetical protein [Kineosporia sp. NBRC 101677]GLY16684.1 hypothetical protein Kisp01_36990 [Kineosporia sp. NBRC 101677]
MSEAPRAVQITPYFFRPDRMLRSFDGVAAEPATSLLNVYAEPQAAAQLWRKGNRDGWLRLSYHGHDLIRPEHWDDVGDLMDLVLHTVGGFVTSGAGEALFPDQPLPLRMYQEGAVAMFSVGQERRAVDPADFVPGVLDATQTFYTWLGQYVPEANEVRELDAIARLRERFQEDPPRAAPWLRYPSGTA